MPGAKSAVLPYAATIFLSAFLLFLVQPIIAKQILPWFGGSSAVWTTALVFFQSTLLAGYAYADLTQRLGVRRQTLLPIQQAEVFGEGVAELLQVEEVDEELAEAHRRALWVYEPDPEELLAELVPEYAQLSVYRALLESTASEHGSRMTAMRNAADNAKEVIGDLTLEMNRVRQAEITQEILEVVGGAEALT